MAALPTRRARTTTRSNAESRRTARQQALQSPRGTHTHSPHAVTLSRSQSRNAAQRAREGTHCSHTSPARHAGRLRRVGCGFRPPPPQEGSNPKSQILTTTLTLTITLTFLLTPAARHAGRVRRAGRGCRHPRPRGFGPRTGPCCFRLSPPTHPVRRHSPGPKC